MRQNNGKPAELQVITVGETVFPVEVRNGRIAVNLTALGKRYGKQKQPSNWLRTDEAQRYLCTIAKLQKCGLADLVEVRNGGTPGLNGTWCYDRRIAVRYAQFCDEYLSIQMDTLSVDAMEGRKFIVGTTCSRVRGMFRSGISARCIRFRRVCFTHTRRITLLSIYGRAGRGA